LEEVSFFVSSCSPSFSLPTTFYKTLELILYLILVGTALYSVTSSAPQKAERVKDSSKIALESKKDR